MFKSKFNDLYNSIIKQCKNLIVEENNQQAFNYIKNQCYKQGWFKTIIDLLDNTVVKKYDSAQEFRQIISNILKSDSDIDYYLHRIDSDDRSQQAERGPDFLDGLNLEQYPISIVEFLQMCKQKLMQLKNSLSQINPEFNFQELNKVYNNQQDQQYRTNLDNTRNEILAHKEENFQKATMALANHVRMLEDDYNNDTYPESIKLSDNRYANLDPFNVDAVLEHISDKYNLTLNDPRNLPTYYFNQNTAPRQLISRFWRIRKKTWYRKRYERQYSPNHHFMREGQKYTLPKNQFEAWFRKMQRY